MYSYYREEEHKLFNADLHEYEQDEHKESLYKPAASSLSQPMLDPRYFDNDTLYEVLNQKKYLDLVFRICDVINVHLDPVGNDCYDFIPLDILRKSLSFIPDIDKIILDCCTNPNYRKNLSREWSMKTCRAVLDPEQFDNTKFWSSLNRYQDIATDTLVFYFRANYRMNGTDYLCYFPELEAFIDLNIKKVHNLQTLLNNCAYNDHVRTKVNDYFNQLASKTLFADKPKSWNGPNPYYNDILGRDSIDGFSTAFYLKFIAGVVASGLGIIAIAIAVSALGATHFAALGLAVMAGGVASIATSGLFFKNAWNELQQPDAYIYKRS